MQRILSRRRIIVLLISVISFGALAVAWFWPEASYPRSVWSGALAPWLIANGELLRAVAAVLSIMGFFVGLVIRRSRKAAERSESPPLTPVSLDDLFARYGRGFAVPWLPRDATFPLDLKRTPRLLLVGRPGQGKTRAGLELIRASVDAALVGKARIFEPDPYAFSTRSAATLVRQMRSTVDPYSPLLVFIDDLPVHFTDVERPTPTSESNGDASQMGMMSELDNLSAALNVLTSYKGCYVVATAWLGDMAPGVHEPWLQRHGFTTLTLRDITPDEQERIFAAAAETWGLAVDPSALTALRAYHTGAAGLPVRIAGMHAATKHAPLVTAESVRNVVREMGGADAAAEGDMVRQRRWPSIRRRDGAGSALATPFVAVSSYVRRFLALLRGAWSRPFNVRKGTSLRLFARRRQADAEHKPGDNAT